MLTIDTLDGQKRMSTQSLLHAIENAVREGETHFTIHASGQHDIGGPLWNSEGKELFFHVTNPGQRVGAMALQKTRILVEGSAPADVGWLNSGGIITVLGDAGDTAGHSASEGKIFIKGRAGTRSGSLMKKDPLAEAPQLWILQSAGSFSFEFMSGGYAIVCGFGQETKEVLGERPCVGMVGGTIYVRGSLPLLPDEVEALPLSAPDYSFLTENLPLFLEHIREPSLTPSLSHWEEWQKIVPCRHPKKERPLSMREFRKTQWISNGLFSDVFWDDGRIVGLVGCGISRLRVPHWNHRQIAQASPENGCHDCRLCEKMCPTKAISRLEDESGVHYVSESTKCIGCGICAGMCGYGIWKMEENTEFCGV